MAGDGRRRLRAPGRLRERREPAAGARLRPPPGAGRALRARGPHRTAGPTPADREHAAGPRRRRPRTSARRVDEWRGADGARRSPAPRRHDRDRLVGARVHGGGRGRHRPPVRRVVDPCCDGGQSARRLRRRHAGSDRTEHDAPPPAGHRSRDDVRAGRRRGPAGPDALEPEHEGSRLRRRSPADGARLAGRSPRSRRRGSAAALLRPVLRRAERRASSVSRVWSRPAPCRWRRSPAPPRAWRTSPWTAGGLWRRVVDTRRVRHARVLSHDAHSRDRRPRLRRAGSSGCRPRRDREPGLPAPLRSRREHRRCAYQLDSRGVHGHRTD